jgi:hypothetical protein
MIQNYNVPVRTVQDGVSGNLPDAFVVWAVVHHQASQAIQRGNKIKNLESPGGPMKKRFLSMLLCVVSVAGAARAISGQTAQAPSTSLNEELLVATRKNNVEQVKALLAKGADVNAKSPYGATPLFFACDRSNVEIVKILLDAGADPNVQDTFYKATPLGWALGKKNPEVLRLLVEKGAKEVEQAMSFAVNGDHAALARTALDKGKFPQEKLDKFLANANRKNSKAVAELLKAAGAKEIAAYNVSPEKLKLYEGAFKSDSLTITIKLKDGKLIGSAQGQDLTLNPVKEHVFEALEQDSLSLTFTVEADKVTGATLKNGNFQMALKKEEAK